MMGPLPESDKGNKYIMVMVDQFSKWVEIQPLAEISAETTARAVFDNFFSRFGYPLQIHTDQGKNFDGNLFQQMCSLLQITKTRTTPYRPCSNGQVERYNHLLLQLIRCYISTRQSAWDEDLQLLAGAIRAMKNRSTGYSANMMMLLMDTFQLVDILMGTEGATLCDEDPSTYLKKLHKTLQEVHQLAREHLRTGLCYQKKTYDLKLQESHFEVGDLVYQLNTVSKKGECKKLKPIWIGPLVVTEVISPVLYHVKDHHCKFVLHHDRLKLCQDQVIPMWVWQLHHKVIDLDTTIAYDEAEQEASDIADESPPSKPEVMPLEPGLDPLDLDLLFMDDDLVPDDSFPGESVTKEEPVPGGDEQSSPEIADNPVQSCDDAQSSQDNTVTPEAVVEPRMSRRGRQIKTPSHLQGFQMY